MKSDSFKALGLVCLGMSAFAFTAPPASAQSLATTVDHFYRAAQVRTDNCPDPQNLPDAPKPNTGISSSADAQAASDVSEGSAPAAAHQKTLARVLTKVKFLSSTAVDVNPNSPGGAGIKDGFLGVTYGDMQINDMLTRNEIPNTEDTKVYFNVTVAVSPTNAGLASAAGSAAKKDIDSTEHGSPWEQQDLNNVDKRVKGLSVNGYTQKMTVTAAVVTKGGKIYTCEVGKSPEVFIPANSPDGTMNKIENMTGGSDDALRVGSSFSTSLGKCTYAKTIGDESQISFGFQGYRNTRPYKDTNTTLGNEIFANNKGYESNQFGTPNAFRAEMTVDKKIKDKVNVDANATAGVAQGKAVYSASGSLRTGRNTISGASSQNYYTSMTGKDPNDPQSSNYMQKQTGNIVADAVKVKGNISAFGAAAWNTGVPNSAQAKTASGVVDFNTQKVGLQYSKSSRYVDPNGTSTVYNEGENRITAAVAYQRTTSPNGSMPEGNSIVGSVRFTTSGDWKSTLKAMKKLVTKGDDDNIKTSVDVKVDNKLNGQEVPDASATAPTATAPLAAPSAPGPTAEAQSSANGQHS